MNASCQERLVTSFSSSAVETPAAYRPPTMAPALTPAMQWMGTRISSRTFRTPICAMPRAPPPLRTRPILGCGGDGGGPAAVEPPAISNRQKNAAIQVRNPNMLFLHSLFDIETPPPEGFCASSA